MNAIVEFINAWGARFAGFALPMLLQSAVLIALLFALDLALRKKVRATVRYAVWMLALVKLALPPSLALPTGAAYWLPAETAVKYSAPTPVTVTAPAEIFVNTISSTSGAEQASAPPRLTGPANFFVVWLVVGMGMGIWVAWRLRTVVGVVRQSTEAPESVRTLLESCRRQLGIKWIIPVRCAAIGSPAICGVLRPVILIPPALTEKLDKAEMRSVLLHELAHYKRGDLWVNHAQILLQIVYWYNPLLWLANARIRRTREQAVDEMVLVEMGGEAQAYPATLLHVAKLGLGRPMATLGLMGILEPGHGLTQRILHIMNRPLPRTARIGVRGLATVLLLALVVLPMACQRKMESTSAPVQSQTAAPASAPNALQNDLKEAPREKPYSLNIAVDKNADPSLVKQASKVALASANPPQYTVELKSAVSAPDSSVLEPLVTEVVELKYGNSTNIIAEVAPTLSPRSTLFCDERTHKLIIRTTEKEMTSAKALIAKLDNGGACDWSGKPEPKYQGKMLTAGEVAALEEKLVQDREDFSSRWDLLFYYFQQGNRTARVKHVLWVIEHHPEYSAGGFSGYLSFVPSMDGSAYDEGKALWLKQVRQHPNNAAILGNAATYLLLFDREMAESLLKKAHALEPRNPAFPEQLGQLYKLEAMTNPSGNGAAKALVEFEKGLTPGTTPDFDKLDDLAKTAFDAGNMEKARRYAKELLKQAQTRQKDWNYGNAIQHGNIVLGRIALREGKVNEAKKDLLAAGKTPGSPQLNSFGPNMSLAQDLLAKGETSVVLEYFKQCGKFWKMSRGRLDQWTALVKDGQTPDFGANLEY